MIKRLGKFELPKQLIKCEDSATDTYMEFVAEPLEPGYGYTVGNTLRRILLSSIEGAAIVSIKVEGVDHEFQSVTGIHEDVTDIVLNLKKILFKTDVREHFHLIIDVDKAGPVLAGDIQLDTGIEVVNANQHICTLSKKMRFYAEIEVRLGRGYCPAEENKKDEQEIGVIPIDALFSPVRAVSYTVENARVGKMTNFDRLSLKISTDGRIRPDEALKEAAAIMRYHLDVFDQANDRLVEFQEETIEVNEENNRLRKMLGMSVNEIELSVRAANCLNNAGITTVGELCGKSEQEMLKYRNFGKKSLNEIKEKLSQLGLSLGMKFEDHVKFRAS
jgi:DNA-directed RNA polymerase subunit alpha